MGGRGLGSRLCGHSARGQSRLHRGADARVRGGGFRHVYSLWLSAPRRSVPIRGTGVPKTWIQQRTIRRARGSARPPRALIAEHAAFHRTHHLSFMISWKKLLLATSFSAPLLIIAAIAETIRVAIGTQDTTINCAAGGPIVRELKLLEKYLPHEGKYKDVGYNIVWENQPTGAQLNSKYLANQLDIVQMADFPSIVGATALEAANNGVHSIYIA